MMGDENTLRDDISFLRQMAESGRKGPILGGIFLAGAGVVFGGASFLDGAMQNGLVPFRIGSGPLWIGAALVFTAFWLAMYFRLMRNKKPLASAQNATFGVIWSACGAGVMVCFLTTILIARDLHSPVVQAAYVPVIYAFYGTAWFASGALARRSWMFYAGLGSYLFAFITALVIDTPYVTLTMGVGLLLLLTAPGLKLAMDEAKS
jgi:hypothetical protein